jgi:hypothetical protein
MQNALNIWRRGQGAPQGRRSWPHAPVLFILFVWGVSVLLTWRIVENPFYDYPALLHACERWANGDLLYKDFQAAYPPLTFWLYGGVMRLFPKSYSAVSALSALIALLMILANYRLARLIHKKWHAALIAAAAYLAAFIVTSVGGENIVSMGLVYVGVPMFAWFVYVVAGILRQSSPRAKDMALAGVLAGLCLLIKHERILGVAAIFAFLCIRCLGDRSFAKHTALLAGIALSIAFAGYGWVAAQSGWFYLKQGFINYGTAGNFLLQILPSGSAVCYHAALFSLLCGLGLLIGFKLTHEPASGAAARKRTVLGRAATGFLVCGALLIAIETTRVALTASRVQWDHAEALNRTATIWGMGSKDPAFLHETINFLGSMLLTNVVPSLLLLVSLVGWWALRWATGRKRTWRIWSGRTGTLALLCLAGSAVQFRSFMARSDTNTFSFLLPVLCFVAPYLVLRVVRIRPTLAWVTRFRGHFLGVLLLAITMAGLAVYAVEQRAARLAPLKAMTDKGAIFLPDIPEHRALVELSDFLRAQHLLHKRIVVVPFEGMQYWLGGRTTPFAWISGALMPEFYHAPWDLNLRSEMKAKDLLYIEFVHAETTVQSNIIGPPFSWMDGPSYRLYRWKESYPDLWSHINHERRLIAAFGPAADPYFRVWE